MRHVIVATGKEKGNAMAEQNRWVEAKAESKRESIFFADFQKSAVRMGGTDTRYGSLVEVDSR